ncbi:MAG: OmpA family protein [Geminicoccaceae bacterium]
MRDALWLAGASLIVLSVMSTSPVHAQTGDEPNFCNAVLDDDDDAVRDKDGDLVTIVGGDPCPQPEVAEPVVEEEVAAVAPADTGPTIDERTIFFELDEDEITGTGLATLDSLIDRLTLDEVTDVTVVGHADTSGPAEYNLDLSRRRAEAVAAALRAEGINATVIETQAEGETNLAVQTEDGVREPANRRVVVEVVH